MTEIDTLRYRADLSKVSRRQGPTVLDAEPTPLQGTKPTAAGTEPTLTRALRRQEPTVLGAEPTLTRV